MDDSHDPRSGAKPDRFRPRRRHYAALALNAGFFAFVAYWLSANVNLAELRTQLRQIPARAIFLAMGINSVALTLYGQRLAAIVGARSWPCFLITTTGFTFNALLPFRLGEGVRLYCGDALFRLPLGGLGAAVIIEKLCDLAMILVLVALIAANAQPQALDVERAAAPAIVVAIVLGGLWIVRERIKSVIPPTAEWAILKQLRLEKLAGQARSVFVRPNLARPAFLTVLLWTANILLALSFFANIAPDTGFGALDAVTVLVIGALAIAVPASPAGLGVFEAGIAAYLTNLHGFPTEKAISAALAYHFSITAPHVAVTALFFMSTFLGLPKLKPKG